jgi:beta-galactosidase
MPFSPDGSVPGLAGGSRFDIAPRQELNFSTGWVFVPKDMAGAEQYEFDDHGFDRVSVPHANIITPHETFDPDMFRFVSWYRKHFRPDEGFRGKQVLIEFQGVMTIADISERAPADTTKANTPFSIDLPRH